MTNLKTFPPQGQREGKSKVPLSEAEAAAYQHDSYLVHIREQSCQNCQSGERWSELFEVWAHPVHTRRTSAIQLRPTLVLRKGFPISYTSIPTVAVPVCSDCIEKFNPEEGSELIPALSHSAWRDTLRRKYTPEEKKPSGSRPEPTLDQL